MFDSPGIYYKRLTGYLVAKAVRYNIGDERKQNGRQCLNQRICGKKTDSYLHSPNRIQSYIGL